MMRKYGLLALVFAAFLSVSYVPETSASETLGPVSASSDTGATIFGYATTSEPGGVLVVGVLNSDGSPSLGVAASPTAEPSFVASVISWLLGLLGG